VPRRFSWPLVWVFSILPLLGWWAYGLLDLDEGYYGAITAEMNRRGEWITPFFNGKPWFEKPILLYLLAKPSVALFGDMIGPRLPSVLMTLATFAVIAWFTRRHFGDLVAKLAVLILASSLLVVGAGRMLLADPPLLFCVTAGLATFWESLVGDRRWRLVSAVCIGFGVLAKGPVAAILFLLILAWTFWREPELRPSFRGQWLAGLVLLAMVVAAWYVPAYQASGQTFIQKFLIEQNVGRFTGGDAAHTLGIASMPLYIPILFLGMAPWSWWIWSAWPRRSAQTGENGPLLRYLAAWAAVIFVFFSISGAKLPHYILPVLPPLAVLVGVRLQEKKWAPGLGLAMCAFMCILANTVFLVWYRLSGQQEAHSLIRYVRQQGGDVALYQLTRRNKALGTGKPKLQETSLPSLLMYLNADAMDTDKLDDLLAHKGPIWVFTRAGRFHPEDFAAAAKAHRQLVQIQPTLDLQNYALYQVK